MAKDFFHDQLGSGTDRIGEKLRDKADDLRSAGENLRSRGNATAANMVDSFADRTDRLGMYLIDTDGKQLVNDLQSFARQRPWLVVGAGLAIGFTVSRVMKAVSAQRGAHRFPSAITEDVPITAYGSP